MLFQGPQRPGCRCCRGTASRRAPVAQHQVDMKRFLLKSTLFLPLSSNKTLALAATQGGVCPHSSSRQPDTYWPSRWLPAWTPSRAPAAADGLRATPLPWRSAPTATTVQPTTLEETAPGRHQGATPCEALHWTRRPPPSPAARRPPAGPCRIKPRTLVLAWLEMWTNQSTQVAALRRSSCHNCGPTPHGLS